MFGFIGEQASQRRVGKLCRVLGVSRSGYYAWKIRPLSKRKLFDNCLITEIKQVHIASRENYGTIKTWKALKAKYGTEDGVNLIT